MLRIVDVAAKLKVRVLARIRVAAAEPPSWLARPVRDSFRPGINKPPLGWQGTSALLRTHSRKQYVVYRYFQRDA